MSEMIERMARALFEDDGRTWPITDPAHRDHFYSQARAAIAAMRAPTPSMIEAGNTGIDDAIDSWNHDSGSGYVVEPHAAFDCWVRMIDAALSPFHPRSPYPRQRRDE